MYFSWTAYRKLDCLRKVHKRDRKISVIRSNCTVPEQGPIFAPQVFCTYKRFQSSEHCTTRFDILYDVCAIVCCYLAYISLYASSMNYIRNDPGYIGKNSNQLARRKWSSKSDRNSAFCHRVPATYVHLTLPVPSGYCLSFRKVVYCSWNVVLNSR